MPRYEMRLAVCRTTEYRAAETNEGPVIEGYFALFGSVYQIAPGLSESIAPGAFTEALDGDIRALTNHDTTLVLGRNKAGTLTLSQDERGLYGRIVINKDDVDAMNLYQRVQRGDVNQCSFGFEIAEENVEVREDGSTHWTIKKVNPLYEVTVATFPAYEETSVAARSADAEALRRRSMEAWREKMNQKLKGER